MNFVWLNVVLCNLLWWRDWFDFSVVRVWCQRFTFWWFEFLIKSLYFFYLLTLLYCLANELAMLELALYYASVRLCEFTSPMSSTLFEETFISETIRSCQDSISRHLTIIPFPEANSSIWQYHKCLTHQFTLDPVALNYPSTIADESSFPMTQIIFPIALIQIRAQTANCNSPSFSDLIICCTLTKVLAPISSESYPPYSCQSKLLNRGFCIIIRTLFLSRFKDLSLSVAQNFVYTFLLH